MIRAAALLALLALGGCCAPPGNFFASLVLTECGYRPPPNGPAAPRPPD